jgi:small neutral amino acid transporter SnatA (MarC family)
LHPVREVGVTGLNIITRLMGLILSAVAVGMIFAGIRRARDAGGK